MNNPEKLTRQYMKNGAIARVTDT